MNCHKVRPEIPDHESLVPEYKLGLHYASLQFLSAKSEIKQSKANVRERFHEEHFILQILFWGAEKLNSVNPTLGSLKSRLEKQQKFSKTSKIYLCLWQVRTKKKTSQAHPSPSTSFWPVAANRRGQLLSKGRDIQVTFKPKKASRQHPFFRK